MKQQCKIHARKSDANNTENDQKWSSKGAQKHPKTYNKFIQGCKGLYMHSIWLCSHKSLYQIMTYLINMFKLHFKCDLSYKQSY